MRNYLDFLGRSKRLPFDKRYLIEAPSSGFNQDTGGGGPIATSGTPSVTYTYPPTPYEYVDFASAPPASAIISFSMTAYTSNPATLNYWRVQDGSGNLLTTPQKINIGGIDIPETSTSYTTPYSTGSLRVNRLLKGSPGIYIDKFSGSSLSLTTIQYLRIQSAVPVLGYRLAANTTDAITYVSPNSSVDIQLGQKYFIKTVDSRGDEKGTQLTITKSAKDLSSTNVPAVIGVDYNIEVADGGSNITFLSDVVFSITLKVNGYTFGDNPWKIITGDVSTNVASSVYNFKAAGQLTATLDVKFPQIVPKPIVPSVVDKTPSGGDFTTYAGQQILVQNDLKIDTGWYKVIVGGSSTTQTKSDSEWRNLMVTKCNIELQVIDAQTNAVILTRTGLDDQTVVIPNQGNYILQYKTTLK